MSQFDKNEVERLVRVNAELEKRIIDLQNQIATKTSEKEKNKKSFIKKLLCE